MAEANAAKKSENPFAYTHGSYWEGSQMPFWIYTILAVFPLTGLLGLDHLVLHSPQTALAKFFMNILGLGIWYWYDVLQVVGDKEYVHKYGLSRPILGSTGLGYQTFREVVEEQKRDQPDLPPVKSTNTLVLFCLYMLTVLAPFGIANFVSGDTAGGFVKFFLTFSLFFFVVLIWNLFDGLSLLYNPTTLFEKGTNNIPPFTWLFEDYGKAWNIMKPSAVEAAKKVESEPKGSFFTRLIQPLLDFLGVSQLLGLVGAAKCAAEPVVNQAIQAAGIAKTAINSGAALAGTVPAVATQVGNQLQAFTDPSKLKNAAAGAAAVPVPVPVPPIAAAVPTMTGGGLASGALDSWVIIALGLLIGGGFALSAVRWLRNKHLEKNDKPVEPKSLSGDDTPPQPTSV